MHHKNILIYIQQDATLHSLFYLETALQERKQLYLQHLAFVTPLLLPAALVAGSCNYYYSSNCIQHNLHLILQLLPAIKGRKPLH
jgi:hypothetical protein